MKPHVPRYTDRPFPRYRFLPGTGQPHPITHPDGHSYVPREARVPKVVALEPEEWDACSEWLWGCDLYNHGYWWEAHEAWEGLWRGQPSGSAAEMLLRGLIQAAAVHIKLHTRQELGTGNLAARSEKLLRAAADATSDRLLGLDVGRFVEAFTAYVRAPGAERYPYLELAP